MRIASVILLFGVLISLAACESRYGSDQLKEDTTATRIPQMESWNAQFGISEFGRMRVQFAAPYLVRYREGDSTETELLSLKKNPQRVTARLFDVEGKESATLTAAMMRYSDRSRRYEARGSVRLVSTKGRRLNTSHLYWLEGDRKVRTEGFVRITTPTEQIQGYNLVADENLANYSIAHPTGIVVIEEE